MERLVDDGLGLLSTQVLMEFFVAATRKLPKRLEPPMAAAIVEDFGSWPVFTPDVPTSWRDPSSLDVTRSTSGMP